MDKKPKVLFLSAGNSSRSLMAEGLLRELAGDSFEAASASVEPGAPNPLAVSVMQAVGIDMSRQQAKTVKQALTEHFGYVVIIADAERERAPIFPFTPRLLRWSLEDPGLVQGSEQDRKEAFRRVRDQIGASVEKFVNENALRQPTKHVLARAS